MARHRQLLVLALCAWALSLRALVPVGWMPAHAGHFSVEPCPAAVLVGAPATMHHSGDKSGHHSGSTGQHSGDCAFAPMHAGFAAAAEAPRFAAPVVVAASPRDTILELSLATGSPAPPPPSTGPPATA